MNSVNFGQMDEPLRIRGSRMGNEIWSKVKLPSSEDSYANKVAILTGNGADNAVKHLDLQTDKHVYHHGLKKHVYRFAKVQIQEGYACNNNKEDPSIICGKMIDLKDGGACEVSFLFQIDV